MHAFGSKNGLQRANTDVAGAQTDVMGRFSEIGRCKSLRDLIALTQKFLNSFDISGFFLFELGCPANFLSTVGNLPSKLIDGIKANSFHNSDLVLRHLLADPRQLRKPIFRSVVDDHIFSAGYEPPAFARHKEFVGYLHSFNIFDIYYYPFDTCEGKAGAAAFCLWNSGNPEVLHQAVELLGNDLALLATSFDRVARTKFASTYNRSTRLIVSDIKLETLRYIALKDISASTVATLRGVHEVTVNKQIAEVKRLLGVSTLPGLIVEAIRSGLVTIDGI